jgi:hypothetical protein
MATRNGGAGNDHVWLSFYYILASSITQRYIEWSGISLKRGVESIRHDHPKVKSTARFCCNQDALAKKGGIQQIERLGRND